MITDTEVLLFAIWQVDNITKLTKNNESKTYIYSHLTPIRYELERQLTNLRHQSKLKSNP